jgi:PAB-dependent poly(A)-specific ribonuclease subunit 2
MGWAHGWFGSNQNRLVLGGNLDRIFGFDVMTNKITDSVETVQGCCVIKPSNKFLCIGHTNGQLSLCDPRTLQKEHTFDAFTGTISDVEVKGDLLVTCGFQDSFGELYIDQMVRAYDLRTMRLLGSVHFPAGPSFLKFHPMFSSMLGIASQSGFFQMLDVQQNMITETNSFVIPNAHIYQVDTQGERVEAFDLSSSGDNVLFGDSGGYLHLWSTKQILGPLNTSSRQHEDIDYSKLLGDSTPLSDWPMNTKCSPFTAVSIHPSLLSRMKLVDGILIGENPGLKVPREGYVKQFNQEQGIKELRLIPKQYAYISVRPSKQKYQEFDFSKFNTTNFIGLENILQYSNFVNATVQVLYHLNEELRISFMNHLCDKPYCLACELGFLFYMFEQAEKHQPPPRTLSANNFIRTLRVIDPKFIAQIDIMISQNVPAGVLSQEFIRYILDSVYHAMLVDAIFYPNAQQFIIAPPKTPKKFIPAMKRKKKNMVEILFGGAIQGSALILSHDLPEHGYGWDDTLRDTLTELESVPNCLVLNCSAFRWLRTVHQRNTFGIKNCSIPPVFYFYYNEHMGAWNVSFENYAPRGTHIKYELRSIISQIRNPLQNVAGHNVALIKVNEKWMIFNDFSVSEAKEDEMWNFGLNWKTPSTLFYVRSDIKSVIPRNPFINPITLEKALEMDATHNQTIETPKKGDKAAIDAEFVLLQKIHGAKAANSTIEEASQLFSLGRVTVLLDRGPESEPAYFIDDYINTPKEAISDYMTRFSGLKAGDLDAETSTHHLTDLKWTYLKLRALVDIGVVFVGHGLKNDFKIINLFVPKEQIIDTVELYQLPRQRKISLRFLSYHLLGKDIQQETHSSEEDAATAIKLYHLYEKLVSEGKFEEILERVYTIGRNSNWTLPSE